MTQPKAKFGKGRISLAVFESVKEDNGFKDFYSLQRSKFKDGKWENDTVYLSVEQLRDVKDLIDQALTAGA